MRILLAFLLAFAALSGAARAQTMETLKRGAGDLLQDVEDLTEETLPVQAACGTILLLPDAPELCGLLFRRPATSLRTPIAVLGEALEGLEKEGTEPAASQAKELLDAWYTELRIPYQHGDSARRMKSFLIVRLKDCMAGISGSCVLSGKMRDALGGTLGLMSQTHRQEKKLIGFLAETYF